MVRQFDDASRKQVSDVKNWGFDIADILSAAHATGGHPQISDGDRDVVISALEDALLDRETKLALLADVKRLCGGNFQYVDSRNEEWFERVLTNGLSELDNEELAILVINPILLCRLADEIENAFPEYPVWWEPMGRVGKRLMDQHGIGPIELDYESLDGPSG